MPCSSLESTLPGISDASSFILELQKILNIDVPVASTVFFSEFTSGVWHISSVNTCSFLHLVAEVFVSFGDKVL